MPCALWLPILIGRDELAISVYSTTFHLLRTWQRTKWRFLCPSLPNKAADANKKMPSPLIQLVVAYSDNRVIGRDNALPWRLPSDLAHFKRVTMGHPIVMGRNTWESLGRPLPGRPNLVISRNPHYQATGASVYATLDGALAASSTADKVCIIGGEQLFRHALDIADEIIATEIHADIEGDTYFPALDAALWREVERKPQPQENGLSFDFVVYRRSRAA